LLMVDVYPIFGGKVLKAREKKKRRRMILDLRSNGSCPRKRPGAPAPNLGKRDLAKSHTCTSLSLRPKKEKCSSLRKQKLSTLLSPTVLA